MPKPPKDVPPPSENETVSILVFPLGDGHASALENMLDTNKQLSGPDSVRATLLSDTEKAATFNRQIAAALRTTAGQIEGNINLIIMARSKQNDIMEKAAMEALERGVSNILKQIAFLEVLLQKSTRELETLLPDLVETFNKLKTKKTEWEKLIQELKQD